jgi:L-alanine-DL-glutamate epimerase-like enolase superfamily enzyme
MTRRLGVRAETWPLRAAFTISRGAKWEARVVVAEIDDGTVLGRGECVPYGRYGETVEAVVAAIEAQAGAVAHGLDRAALGRTMAPGAARNALDCALWDLEAKRAGERAWGLAGLAAPAPAVTAETIGIDTCEAMGAAAARLAGRPLIKVKLGAEDVLGRIRAVRAAAPATRLVVDANEAWSMELLAQVAPGLAGLGVEMIEQPLAAGADQDLAGFDSPVPLCADESCHGAADVGALAGAYALVNIKLDKTGGLSAALELAAAARRAGLGVMVGCMVGTSLAMAPATLLMEGAACVDLDGPLWLKRDRDHGLDFIDGRVHPPGPALWG